MRDSIRADEAASGRLMRASGRQFGRRQTILKAQRHIYVAQAIDAESVEVVGREIDRETPAEVRAAIDQFLAVHRRNTADDFVKLLGMKHGRSPRYAASVIVQHSRRLHEHVENAPSGMDIGRSEDLL